MAEAKLYAISMVLVICALFQSKAANAETYTVGDSQGWDFGVSTWPNGKRFQPGDVLVFSYDRAKHDVTIVKEHDYEACTTSGSSQRHQTGYDSIPLSKGINYFISSFPGQCTSGLKMVVTAQ